MPISACLVTSEKSRHPNGSKDWEETRSKVWANNIICLVTWSFCDQRVTPAKEGTPWHLTSAGCRRRHVPERALHAFGLPRPLFLIFVSLLTAAVAVLCAYASLAALYPAAFLADFAFGGHWSLAPALACDFFGLRHFASNYCLLQVRPPLSNAATAD